MTTRATIIQIILGLSAIVSISIVYGLLGFVYSFFGLVQQSNTIVILEPFRLITLEELGGHFLFGAIIGIPTRNIKIILLAGLMAITIDSDHLLNFAGFHVTGRPDHSIAFAVLSSLLMGLFASRIYYKATRGDTITTTTTTTTVLPLDRYGRLKKINGSHKEYITSTNIKATGRNGKDDIYDVRYRSKQFLSLLIVTVAVFMSHVAYDTFVDSRPLFPLLIPFSFDQILIPGVLSLPIEGAAFLLVYLYFPFSHRPSIFALYKKKTTATRV